MKVIASYLLRIILIFSLCLVVFFIYQTRGYDLTMTTSPNPLVNSAVSVELTATNNSKEYTPHQVDLEIYNKYNISEKYTFEQVPNYVNGKYLIVFTPQYSGTYIVNIEVTNEQDHNPLSYQYQIEVN